MRRAVLNRSRSGRQRLHWFLGGWLGDPQHYAERFGHPRLRMRHMPFAIGIRERDQGLALHGAGRLRRPPRLSRTI